MVSKAKREMVYIETRLLKWLYCGKKWGIFFCNYLQEWVGVGIHTQYFFYIELSVVFYDGNKTNGMGIENNRVGRAKVYL